VAASSEFAQRTVHNAGGPSGASSSKTVTTPGDSSGSVRGETTRTCQLASAHLAEHETAARAVPACVPLGEPDRESLLASPSCSS
jgi:hypothetical protein